jgi:hypothetical protein
MATPSAPGGLEHIPLDEKVRRDMFDRWVCDNALEIGNVQLLMAQPLSDEPQLLIRQMSEIEAQFERMNALFADAKSFYYLEKRASLVARANDITDLDRESIQKAAVANQRRVMDTLEGIVEAVRTRLMLGMNLRKTHVAERSTDRPQEEERR